MRSLLLACLFAALPVTATVPYVPTPEEVTGTMLSIAGVGPKDYVIDLGSGDGRIVIGAAQRGAKALGVEINSALVDVSRSYAKQAGVDDRARFVEQDLFRTDLSQATVITMYLLPHVNMELRPRLLALAPGTRIVSHDWDLGDWAADRFVVVQGLRNPGGYEKTSTVHFWVVPAKVQGLWCAGATALRLDQAHQKVAAEFDGGPGVRRKTPGELRGKELHLGTAGATEMLKATVENGVLTVREATGAFSVFSGALRPATGATCGGS